MHGDYAAILLELKAAHHCALTEHRVPLKPEGRVVSMGCRAAFAEAELIDGEGRLCASAISTLLVSPLERKSA